ncbi:hypothetical protein [Sinorhizobium meliloti]|uniref:hypothetical protein n=1 Tax=Rhizobium meliloti TaxID=382 RepID=UPI000FD481DF|nr:hypothetical protein [Sinorhizobium meliloti]RVJ41205.1 hypothetical protein CN175_33260 [Sinorhizobium meliloti]RVJ64573.1 hypothetical protein CN171_34335 [Sinorhizobium meliloti]RVJ86426.1 hypothetical protein CN169_27810 [Sinorhizobium meliloti]
MANYGLMISSASVPWKSSIERLVLCLSSCLLALAWLAMSPVHAATVEHYYDIKRVGTRLIGTLGFFPNEINNDLFICEGWSETLGSSKFSSQMDSELLDIAGAIVEWRGQLGAWLPKKIWHPRLVEAEKRLVNNALKRSSYTIEDEALRLIKDLNAKGISPNLIWQGECGAGGYVYVTFATEPPNGQVSIISEFDYELCKLKGHQNDPTRCTAWRIAKRPEAVSGAYYIKVKWRGREEGPLKYDRNPWGSSFPAEGTYWLRFP